MGKGSLSTLRERFEAKVNRQEGEACDLWTASVTTHGYGQINVEGRPVGAHRVAWFLEHGSWPADCVLHRCDMRLCVKVTHLFEGDREDNIHDMVNKGRHGNRNKTHCPQGHPYAGANLAIVKKEGGKYARKCRICLGETTRKSNEKRSTRR